MLFFLHRYGTKKCCRHKHKEQVDEWVNQRNLYLLPLSYVIKTILALPLYGHYCSTLLMLLPNMQYELFLASYKMKALFSVLTIQ